MITRVQLSLFVPPAESADLEAVRRLLDPVQASLIPAHVTLCREDELATVELAALQSRLAAEQATALVLRFGPPESFAGHGVLMPCIAGEAEFHSLRQWILGSRSVARRAPHLTLAHPRNSRAPSNFLANACSLSGGRTVKFAAVHRIEQEGSAAWQVLERYQLRCRPNGSPSKSVADPLPLCAGGVALRRLSVADLALFQAYRSDPALGRYQGWSVMSDADALVFLDAMSTAPLFAPGRWIQIGIASPDGLTLLGDIGLHLSEDSRQAQIGFTLSRSAQGRGLATAAVREALGLVLEATVVESILGLTDARNLPSIRLLERVGMRRQTARDAVYRGEPCVEYVYSLSRADA